MTMSMVMIWLMIFVVFLVVEVVTVGLVSIWFCVGAVAAMVAATFYMSPMIQLTIFFAVSIFLLLGTKPFVKKVLNTKIVHTNADKVLNEKAIVTEEIDNKISTGAVKVEGKVWTARSSTEEVIPVGKEVTILEIQGVKLIVTAE